MKENLKIKVNDFDRQEVIDLLGQLGKSFAWDVKTKWGEISTIYTYKKQNLEWDQDHGDAYFQRHGSKEITIKELRELAKPREYLDENFKLVVTNQPKDGWRLVPEGAECYAQSDSSKSSGKYFYKNESFDLRLYHDNCWTSSSYSDKEELFKILWQRTPQQETIMEKKGRFLHQEWYEAFGRGQDVERRKPFSVFNPITSDDNVGIFNDADIKFRLKPQTITIGSRTINKPISVKPEIGQEFFVTSMVSLGKFLKDRWADNHSQNEMFNRNLCHLTAEDAIKHCEALLSLMESK